MANLSLVVRIHVASVLAFSPRRLNVYRCQLLSRTILKLGLRTRAESSHGWIKMISLNDHASLSMGTYA